MKRLMLLFVLLLAAGISGSFAQQRVQMRNMYERLYLVVPMVGSGTDADPRRPMYVPMPAMPGVTPATTSLPVANGIIAWAFQESDDGNTALLELVARDQAAFKPILDDHNPQVKVFHKGKDKKNDIEAEFRKHKQNFDLDSLAVNIP